MALIMDPYITKLNSLSFKKMYNNDFFLTWEKTFDEILATWTVADALRTLRESNISTKIFESGLGISLFRDNSTRMVWKYRIWTKANLKLPTEKPSVKPLIWFRSWLTLSVSAMICTSAKAIPTCTPLWMR